MPSLVVRAFGGMRPALSARLLEAHVSQLARDCHLTNGRLTPFRDAQTIAVSATDIGTISRRTNRDGGPIAIGLFQEDAAVVPCSPCEGVTLDAVFPECGASYFTADAGKTRHPIGVLPPATALRAVITDAGQTTPAGPDLRSYTYTYVDKFGIESAPAPASGAISANDTATVRLTGFATPPVTVGAVRIYRTGAKTPEEPKQEVLTFNTPFHLAMEVAPQEVVGGITLTQRLSDMEFGGLDTTMHSPPPKGLRGVMATDFGYYVGFVADTLWVSERNEIWNWPAYNTYKLPHMITGIAESNDTIYLATVGPPARVKMSVKEDNLLDEPSVVIDIDILRSEYNFPGVSRRSICATPFGAVYVSKAGLIAIGEQGGAVNTTRESIGEREWPQYAPTRIVWQQGFVYGISPHKEEGIRIELRGTEDGPKSLGDIVLISMQGQDVFADADGHVYYAKGKSLLRWDTGVNTRMYLWQSRRYSLPKRMSFCAGRIIGNFGPPVKLTLFKVDISGTPRACVTRYVRNGAPFRLPPGNGTTEYIIQVEGTSDIDEIHLATSITELSEAQSGNAG